MIKRDTIKKISFVILVISIVFIVIGLTYLIMKKSMLPKEEADMIILITSKEDETYVEPHYNASSKTLQIIEKHRYYFVWADGKIDVDKNVYEKYAEGNKIFIKKIIIYEEDGETIHSIKYRINE